VASFVLAGLLGRRPGALEFLLPVRQLGVQRDQALIAEVELAPQFQHLTVSAAGANAVHGLAWLLTTTTVESSESLL